MLLIAPLVGAPADRGTRLLPTEDVAPAGTPTNHLIYLDTSIENASPVWHETAADSTIVVHLLDDRERSSRNRAAGHIHFLLHAAPRWPPFSTSVSKLPDLGLESSENRNRNVLGSRIVSG